MPCLGEIGVVFNNLRQQRKDAVYALFKFVFEAEGDRTSRRKLREFEGFTFDEDDEQFKRKLEYVNANLRSADLISICNVLGVTYKVDDLTTHIFKNLQKGKLLAAASNDDDDIEDDDEFYSNDGDDAVDRTLKRHCGEDDGAIGVKATGGVDDYAVAVHDDDVIVGAAKDGAVRVGVAAANLNMNATHGQSYRQQSDEVRVPYVNNHFSGNIPKFAMSFRDIEDSIRIFDGSGQLPIRTWINEFEETAIVMYWDDLQKFVFAKKSLRGLAKLFISSEKGITSYDKLKRALLDEFDTTTNSAQLHKMLCERRMRKDEGVHEYYLNMKELAARGDVDDNSLIQYVIDGVNDLDINKMILYGSKNMNDFKEKLKCYEIMRKNYKGKNNFKKPEKEHSTVYNKPDLKCFNCGAKGHLSVNCSNKSRGTKCFKCDNYGHIAKECPTRKIETNVRLLNTCDDIMKKEVKFGEMETTALFDTGSKVNITTERFWNNIISNKPRLSESNFYLVGFGKKNKESRIKPLGNFKYIVMIDGESFDLTFHVVSSDYLDIDVVLGKEFCLHADVSITSKGMEIHKKYENNEESKLMLKIDLEDDQDLNIDAFASPRAKQIVADMINNYVPTKTKNTNVEMKIVLKDDTPIFCSPRRLPFQERSVVDSQVDQWLNEGIIEPSVSEYSSPVVLVKKRDGTPRLCIDYRRINKVIIKDRYPLPLIEDLLDRLQDANIFSTLDLRNGFFHVSVEESSKMFTSFVTHNGQYQFRKVPFGLSNSPGVFQRYVNAIFRDLTRQGIALPYVDDVIIPAKNEDEALKNLTIVLEHCKDYGLEINLRKCQFLKKRIQFLGHVIENRKISPSPEKVEALIKYPVPRNQKQIESFLGLANHFRKFIPKYSLIAKPLTDLKKQDRQFEMGESQMLSFKTLKNILSQTPVLQIYNQNYETEVHTDASMDGYGAVLLQKSPEDNQLHPIYYMSRKTSTQERKYSSYELEILAVIEALKKFRVYLLGIHFKIVTDCNAFTKTLDKKDLCTRVARWILFLEEYNYTVEHRPGVQMKHVDALSRYPIYIMKIDDSIIGKIRQSQMHDEDLRTMKELLMEKSSYNDYFLKGDVIYKVVDDRELLVVPKGFQREVIKQAHDKGHFALKKTKELLCRDYFIKNIDEKIKNHIANCIPCIIVNRKKGKQEGELNPLPKDELPLQIYHIDFLGPLETTNKQYNHIFAVIDSFTKFCWLYPTKSTSAKDAISKLEAQSMIFGNPKQIISDRGSAFTSDNFREYCEMEKIRHHTITTGLPRANGQIERLNSVITPVLSKLSIENPSKWWKYVGKVQQILNCTYNRSINSTPFEILIGAKMRCQDDIRIKELIETEFVTNFNDRRLDMRRDAKQQILKIQDENKRTYNLRRKPPEKYHIDDVVAIKRTQFGGGLKLKPKFLGPYRVANVKPNNTYDVIKVGNSDGPKQTSTCPEFMKRWPVQDFVEDDTLDNIIEMKDVSDNGFETNQMQDGRNVGKTNTQEAILPPPTCLD